MSQQHKKSAPPYLRSHNTSPTTSQISNIIWRSCLIVPTLITKSSSNNLALMWVYQKPRPRRMACKIHALGAWHTFPDPVSPIFRRFKSSSSNNLPRNLGTKFLPPVSLLRPFESSFLVFLILHKSLDVLVLPIYRLKYRKHYKCPEIIGNRSNTPPFCC